MRGEDYIQQTTSSTARQNQQEFSLGRLRNREANHGLELFAEGVDAQYKLRSIDLSNGFNAANSPA